MEALVKQVSAALLAELRARGAFVGDRSTQTGVPLINGFVDIDDLAKVVIKTVLEHLHEERT